MTPDPAQSLENLRLERDAILLYDALGRDREGPGARGGLPADRRATSAAMRRSGRRSCARPASTSRRRRAARGCGSPRSSCLARLFGTARCSDLVTALEGDEEETYGEQASPEVEAIAADEREHAEIWRRLEGSGLPPAIADIADRERWHRAGRSGTLRAVIFGVSDGLVSNLALVMGVAGAAGRRRGPFILLAGIAGLLAGAFSMAAGEYISMQTQRELFERQIELERAELEAMPEEEEAELAAALPLEGVPRGRGEGDRPAAVPGPRAGARHAGPRGAGPRPGRARLAVGARPAGRSSRSRSARSCPVVPYLARRAARRPSSPRSSLSLAALFAVGAAVSLLTGRSAIFSGVRQVGIGAAAAIVTFAVGSLIGVSVAG